MNKENEPPVSLHFDDSNKENEPPQLDTTDKENLQEHDQPPQFGTNIAENAETLENVENTEIVENVENAENAAKANDETLVEEDPDKENRDPNAVRRSQRATKKPLRLAQEKVGGSTKFLSSSSILHLNFKV